MKKEILALCLICFFVYGLIQLPTEQSRSFKIKNKIENKKIHKKVEVKKTEPDFDLAPAKQDEWDESMNGIPHNNCFLEEVNKMLDQRIDPFPLPFSGGRTILRDERVQMPISSIRELEAVIKELEGEKKEKKNEKK